MTKIEKKAIQEVVMLQRVSCTKMMLIVPELCPDGALSMT